MTPRRAVATGDGFTLVEMMIAITILAIITVPLVSSFALGVGESASNSQAVSDSADAQLLASFFSTDVASASTVSTLGSCGSSIAGAQPVLQFDNGAGAVPRYSAYISVRNSALEPQLHLGGADKAYQLIRVTCDATSAVIGKTALVNAMNSATPPTVCVPGAGGPEVACSGTPTPQTVSLQVTEWEVQPSDPAAFAYTLKATRRVSP